MSPSENVAFESVLTSPAVIIISCLSYLDDLVRWGLMAIQLLFCRVLLPEFVRNCMQHSWKVFIWFFSPSSMLASKWCNHRVVLTWLQLGSIPILFLQRDQIFRWSLISPSEFMLVPKLNWDQSTIFVAYYLLMDCDKTRGAWFWRFHL